MVWKFLAETLVEYLVFIIFDLWAKTALKRAENEAQRRHIWASESQIFLILSIVVCLWQKIFPLTWLIITCCGYLRSYGLTLNDLPELISKWLKIFGQNVKDLSWNGMIFIWFSFSVMVGNAIDNIFNKVFSGDRHTQTALENVVIYIGSCMNYMLSTIVNFLKLLFENVHRTYAYWSEVFTHGNWDYSSQQYLVSPPLPEIKQNKPIYSHDSEITQNGLGKIGLCSPLNARFCPPSRDLNLPTTPVTSENGESRLLSVLLLVKYKFLAFMTSILTFMYSIFQKLRSCNSVFASVGPLENLCFMNTVMCCLTKEPGLVANLDDCLSDVVLNGLVLSSQEIQFLQTFRELLQSSDGFDLSVLQQFQECCSITAPALVAKSSRNQQQQDAAEFCLWLLNYLHQCLNSRRESSFFIRRGLAQRLPGMFDNAEVSPVGIKRQKWNERGSSLLHPNDTLLKNLLQISTLEWNSYERKNMSPISSCFTGQTVEIHQCAMCNQMSTHIQIFTILPVAVPTTPASVSLNDILQDFLQVEEIEVEEQCACMLSHSRIGSPLVKSSFRVATSPLHSSLNLTPMSSSIHGARTSTPLSAQTSSLSTLSVSLPGHNSNVLSPINFHQNEIYQPLGTQFSPLHRTPKKKLLKRTFISKTPKYLVIQLLRFNYDTKKGVMKNKKPIDIPLFSFCVPSFKKPENCWGLQQTTGAISKQEYELFAVIVHLGAESASFGHYIAYARCNNQGEWRKCDGTLSKTVDMSAEIERSCIKENAYLLFYQQTKVML